MFVRRKNLDAVLAKLENAPGGMTAGALREAVGMSRYAFALHMARLERKGCVIVEADWLNASEARYRFCRPSIPQQPFDDAIAASMMGMAFLAAIAMGLRAWELTGAALLFAALSLMCAGSLVNSIILRSQLPHDIRSIAARPQAT